MTGPIESSLYFRIECILNTKKWNQLCQGNYVVDTNVMSPFYEWRKEYLSYSCRIVGICL